MLSCKNDLISSSKGKCLETDTILILLLGMSPCQLQEDELSVPPFSVFLVTFQEVFDLGRINFIWLVFKAGTSLVETDTGGDGSSVFNNACKPLPCWSSVLVQASNPCLGCSRVCELT